MSLGGFADRDILAMLLAEAKRRINTREQAVDISDHLFDKQLEPYHSTQRIIPLRTGRRFGKTKLVAARVIGWGLQRSRVVVPYITLTRRNAKLQIWPELKRLVQSAAVDCSTNEADLTITLPNGSVVMLGGCDNATEIEKYRGHKLGGAAVDEMGTFPPYIRSLIVDALQPGLADVRGQMMLTGTPGPVLEGLWYELSGPDSPYHVYTGTMFDNPHMADANAEAREILRLNHWDEEHPTYQREWLGRWIRDGEALVFPFDIADQVDKLPEKDGWRYVLGVDIGHIDQTAYVVMAGQRAHRHDYVVESAAASGLLIDQVADDIRRYRAKYPGISIVMDVGGMGKQHAEELRRRFGIPVKAAEKRDKLSAIRVLRDLIRGHQIRMLDGKVNDPLRHEWAVLRWNDDRTEIADGQVDHASHAALYAHRELRNYLYKPREPEKSWEQREKERIMQNVYKRVRKQSEWS